MTNLKFMYNGIKAEGKLSKGHYSKGSFTGFPEGTITIYSKGYDSFPKVEGLGVENDSDSQTDYFEADKIRVTPSDKFYKEVHVAFEKQESKLAAKRMTKA